MGHRPLCAALGSLHGGGAEQDDVTAHIYLLGQLRRQGRAVELRQRLDELSARYPHNEALKQLRDTLLSSLPRP
jgi:hypothetical protein